MPNFTPRHQSKGGRPVFAGAQGCVFIPSLKCKHQNRNVNDGNISKLGYKKSSEFEMREYDKISPFLKKIKNYDKYFNIKASLCEPDALTASDLVGFNKVCKNFKKNDINATNVNSKLYKLRSINMPDLGVDLKGWMEKKPIDAHRLRKLNDHLSELLMNAVVPMNQEGVIHNDLKSENIMMDKNEANTRIIDWGLAGITTPSEVIPDRYFINNPVTFNRPFSTMVISTEIDNLYNKYASQTDDVLTLEQLKPLVREIYKEYRKLAPTGHEYLTYIFETIFNLKSESAEVLLNDTVEKYNAKILHHFTDSTNRHFMMEEYFNKVYRYNTDIWGVMSVYYSIFMMPRNHFRMTDSTYYEMLRHYRNLFQNMVFVNGHKRMNVQDIVEQLHEINKTVTKYTKTKTSKSKSRSNKSKSRSNKSKSRSNKSKSRSNKSKSRSTKLNKTKKIVRFNLNEKDVYMHKHNHNRIPTPHPIKWINELMK